MSVLDVLIYEEKNNRNL